MKTSLENLYVDIGTNRVNEAKNPEAIVLQVVSKHLDLQ